LLIWCILLELLGNCVVPMSGIGSRLLSTPGLSIGFLVCTLALHVCVIVGVVSLMRALRRNIVWIVLCGFAMLMPLLGLLILLSINSQATRHLREAGIKVGFMGVSDEVVRRATSANICQSCGYDLTGNESGVCPECGTAVARPGTCRACGWKPRDNIISRYCERCGAAQFDAG